MRQESHHFEGQRLLGSSSMATWPPLLAEEHRPGLQLPPVAQPAASPIVAGRPVAVPSPC